MVLLRSPPAHLYAEATIERFRQTVRDIFLSADQTLAKNYLRFLVERLVVRGNDIEIHGKADASVALLAASPDLAYPAPVNPPAEVLTSVGGWLPNSSTSKNLFTVLVVDFGRQIRGGASVPTVAAAERALEWRRLLERGVVESGAALARRFGLSGARVTQVLARFH